MKITSKFLTAEARIMSAKIEKRKLVIEGLVKEFMPMTIEIGGKDLAELLRALVPGRRARAGGTAR
ncbi:MAG: hypothetical protein HY720_09450 [Planctomycetes bacterium]|nr:hypothetical protein [Planctomycetota bacterium]